MSQLPSRAVVEDCWRGLIGGNLTRHDVHEWAVKWVEGRQQRLVDDPMVRNGLQYLHGFDLVRVPDQPGKVRHAQNGDFLRSDGQIAQELERWLDNCEAYDADPDGYMRDAMARVNEHIHRSQGDEDRTC
jgi:hypothetical protein